MEAFTIFRKIRGLIIGGSLMMGLFLLPNQSLALGVSPAEVHIDNLINNGNKEIVFHLSRTAEEANTKEMGVKITVDGDNSDIIQFDPEAIFKLGETEINYVVTLSPDGLPNDSYSMYINFEETSTYTETQGTGAVVGVRNGVSPIIKYTITDEQILDYEFISLSAYDTETDKPLLLEYGIMNKGNVKWRPDSIKVTLIDQVDSANIIEHEITENIEYIEPSASATVITQEITGLDLSEGTYIAQVEFKYNDEIVETLETQQFTVFKPNTLAQQGNLSDLSTNKTEYNIGEKIKLDGIFSNEGDIPVNVVMITELSIDGEIKDLIKSDSVLIGKSEESELSQLIDAEKSGDYTFSVYAEYGNKKTNISEISVKVKSDNILASEAGSFVILGVLAVLIIGVVVIVVLIRKKKKNNKKK